MENKMHGAMPGTATSQTSTDSTSTSKQFNSLAARAALLGHTLQRHSGGFLIGRWGQTREFDSLADAAQWLDRIGGAK